MKAKGAPQGATLHLVTDDGAMCTGPAPALTWRTTPSLATSVRAELRRPAKEGAELAGAMAAMAAMAAMTNPIRLGRPR